MKNEEDFLVYDDEAAVKFILKQLPDELRKDVNEEKIDYILDVLYDYYEEKGLIDEDSAEEASIDEEEMLEYVMKAAQNDNVELSEEIIILILDAEYEYGKKLGIYSEEE